MDKIKFYIGKKFVGLSNRFGLILSFEEAGVFFIIHWKHTRQWIGIGIKPRYLDNRSTKI